MIAYKNLVKINKDAGLIGKRDEYEKVLFKLRNMSPIQIEDIFIQRGRN